ncbi:MAG: hypothetical protein LBB54_02300, partial [Cellulomonadaceae bacterium]|nr:hypothetical protein [Cellulomonadaceae bacterium]
MSRHTHVSALTARVRRSSRLTRRTAQVLVPTLALMAGSVATAASATAAIDKNADYTAAWTAWETSLEEAYLTAQSDWAAGRATAAAAAYEAWQQSKREAVYADALAAWQTKADAERAALVAKWDSDAATERAAAQTRWEVDNAAAKTDALAAWDSDVAAAKEAAEARWATDSAAAKDAALAAWAADVAAKKQDVIDEWGTDSAEAMAALDQWEKDAEASKAATIAKWESDSAAAKDAALAAWKADADARKAAIFTDFDKSEAAYLDSWAKEFDAKKDAALAAWDVANGHLLTDALDVWHAEAIAIVGTAPGQWDTAAQAKLADWETGEDSTLAAQFAAWKAAQTAPWEAAFETWQTAQKAAEKTISDWTANKWLVGVADSPNSDGSTTWTAAFKEYLVEASGVKTSIVFPNDSTSHAGQTYTANGKTWTLELAELGKSYLNNRVDSYNNGTCRLTSNSCTQGALSNMSISSWIPSQYAFATFNGETQNASQSISGRGKAWWPTVGSVVTLRMDGKTYDSSITAKWLYIDIKCVDYCGTDNPLLNWQKYTIQNDPPAHWAYRTWTESVDIAPFTAPRPVFTFQPKPFEFAPTAPVTPGDFAFTAPEVSIVPPAPTFDMVPTVTIESPELALEVFSHGEALTIAKTADATFDRTLAWDIEKQIFDPTANEGEGGWVDSATKKADDETGTASFDYRVIVTPQPLSESDYAINGSITVSNPNPWAVDATVTENPDLGEDVLCGFATESEEGFGISTVIDVTVPAQSSVELDYTCTIDSETGTVPQGTNVATVSWDPESTLTEVGSASATADIAWVGPETDTLANYVVTIRDDFAGQETPDMWLAEGAEGDNTCTWNWNVETGYVPCVFEYTLVLDGPGLGDSSGEPGGDNMFLPGFGPETVTYLNTAWIQETEQSDTAEAIIYTEETPGEQQRIDEEEEIIVKETIIVNNTI